MAPLKRNNLKHDFTEQHFDSDVGSPLQLQGCAQRNWTIQNIILIEFNAIFK